jgi:hypothetical protein
MGPVQFNTLQPFVIWISESDPESCLLSMPSRHRVLVPKSVRFKIQRL